MAAESTKVKPQKRFSWKSIYNKIKFESKSKHMFDHWSHQKLWFPLAWQKKTKKQSNHLLWETKTFPRCETLTYGAVGGEAGVIGRCLHVSGLVVAGRNPEGFAPSPQTQVYHRPAEKERENQQDEDQNQAPGPIQCPQWAVGGQGDPWETVPSLSQLSSLWRSDWGRRLAVWHQTSPLCHFRVILCCRIAHPLHFQISTLRVGALMIETYVYVFMCTRMLSPLNCTCGRMHGYAVALWIWAFLTKLPLKRKSMT